MNRMLSSVIFALLAASVVADMSQYSYSPSKGSARGIESTLVGKGQITAVRLWSGYNSFIYGIQLRFGPLWSRVMGRTVGSINEMELYEDEAIIQVSGKYGHYIQQLVFVTTRGRFLMAGQPLFQSFSMYPENKDAQLVFISGRHHGALTAIAAHWAVVNGTS